MARLSQAFLDDLLDRLDIVEVIDRRVKLKKPVKIIPLVARFMMSAPLLFLSIQTSSFTTALAVALGVTPSVL